MLKKTHHVAVFCSDYEKAVDFYVNKLGFVIEQETYRESMNDYIRMMRSGDVVLELFVRNDLTAPSENPAGLRHLAFHVDSVEEAVAWLNSRGIPTDPIRHSPFTGKPLAFFYDPDGLPLEVIEE